MAQPDCINCGCMQRIVHLEAEDVSIRKEIDKVDKKTQKVLSKFNHILISIAFLALTLALNLGYMILHP